MLDGRQLRNRQADIEADIGRELAELPAFAPAIVIKIVAKVSLPTSASRVFACKRQTMTIAAGEVENATVVMADGSDYFYAVNVGSRVPTVNSYWVAWICDGLWVFGQNA